MSDLKGELAKNIGALAESAAQTNRAEDRAVYMQHLAAAALMFLLLKTKRKALRWPSGFRTRNAPTGGVTLPAR